MPLDDEKRLSSNKQAVEWIAMMLRECPDFNGMAGGDGQFLKPALPDGRDEQRWVNLNLAELGLDGNFPD